MDTAVETERKSQRKSGVYNIFERMSHDESIVDREPLCLTILFYVQVVASISYVLFLFGMVSEALSVDHSNSGDPVADGSAQPVRHCQNRHRRLRQPHPHRHDGSCLPHRRHLRQQRRNEAL